MKNIFDGPTKHSVHIAFDIVAGISTIVGIWGFTLRDISEKMAWWQCLLILIAAFLIISVICRGIIEGKKHQSYETSIHGKKVVIKEGNIFEEDGLKVIPFNEYFDTLVDDIVISSRSLNGKMIKDYVSDIEELNQTIISAKNDVVSIGCPVDVDGRSRYPLGRIIKYQGFAMLAFSHFNAQNEAYISIGDYEKCLFNMWRELRRVYASEHIVIPLIGSGITTIEGVQTKNNTELLKCILCSLRGSKFIPDNGVTIVLTKETINEIDMNRIREEF